MLYSCLEREQYMVDGTSHFLVCVQKQLVVSIDTIIHLARPCVVPSAQTSLYKCTSTGITSHWIQYDRHYDQHYDLHYPA